GVGARHHSRHPVQAEPQQEGSLQQEVYKMRHKVENLFAKSKDWRRIATHYDRCALSCSLLSS
ncbi:Mobile element protein, partial [Candidatus Synechococcus spongiarum]